MGRPQTTPDDEDFLLSPTLVPSTEGRCPVVVVDFGGPSFTRVGTESRLVGRVGVAVALETGTVC